jgi:hypothetical protein
MWRRGFTFAVKDVLTNPGSNTDDPDIVEEAPDLAKEDDGPR